MRKMLVLGVALATMLGGAAATSAKTTASQAKSYSYRAVLTTKGEVPAPKAPATGRAARSPRP